jgi:hypothetical protein
LRPYMDWALLRSLTSSYTLQHLKKGPAQVQNAQPQLQLANGGGDDDGQCEGLINVCVDVDL